MSDLTTAIRDLPQQSWIPILVLLVIGLAMWFAGARLLRAAFGGLGFLVGGTAGWLVGNAINLGVPGWAVAIVGGLLLACLATLAYRPAVAGGLALVLAVGAPLAVWSVGQAGSPDGPGTPAGETTGDGGTAGDAEEDDDFVGPPIVMSGDEQGLDEEDQIRKLLEEAAKRLGGLGGGGRDDGGGDSGGDSGGDGGEDGDATVPDDDDGDSGGVFGDIGEKLEKPLAEARTFAEKLAAAAREAWQEIPPKLRQRMIGAAVVGGLVGFLFGTLATAISASVVTAFAGSMAWLAGGWAGVTKLGVPQESWIPASPNGWLLLWIVVAVIGLAIQWMTRPRRADKSA